MSDAAWQVFNVESLRASLAGTSPEYREFLRTPHLSCGVYQLPRGARDMQTPHDEDEVYYVIAGRGTLKVGDTTHEVRAGSVLYVRATEAHTFFEIEEDMTLLVFFADAL